MNNMFKLAQYFFLTQCLTDCADVGGELPTAFELVKTGLFQKESGTFASKKVPKKVEKIPNKIEKSPTFPQK